MTERLSLFSIALFFAAPAFAQWAPPTVATPLNSTASDLHSSLSGDGLTIYLASFRSGNWEIYAATRSAPFGAFGAPVLVAELSDPTAVDAGPHVRADGLEIFFDSNRAGGGGGSFDLWRATRSSTSVPFSPPVPITELNTSSAETSPSVTADGLTIFLVSNRVGGPGSSDVWTAARPDLASPFGPATPVVEVSTPGAERDPYISGDGLTVYWISDMPGGLGSADVWKATRLSPAFAFSNLANVTALNSTTLELAPATSLLGDETFFSSFRPGGLGSYDIWTSRFTGLTSHGIAGIASGMSLRFSDPASPGLTYVAAASFGTTPGIFVGTGTIPLNPDPLFFLTAGGIPGILNGFIGTLDPNGVADGSITLPNDPLLLGIQFFVAFVVLDLSSPSGIGTISNPLEVLVQ